MDQENRKDQSKSEDWYENLESFRTEDEIGTDEHAVSSHEMSSLSDMELDNIIREALSDDWNLDEFEQDAISDSGTGILPEEENAYDQAPAEETPPVPIYSDEEPEDIPEETGGVPRKVRPKRKSRYGLLAIPHLASTVIWLVIAVIIGTSLGHLLWVCASDILAFGREDQEVSITITEEDNLDTITEKLQEAGLIRYPSLFKMYAKLAKVEEKGKISAGTFVLNTLYDYHALVNGMSATSSYRQTVEVTVPEGYTSAQIYRLLEDAGVCTVEELEAYCAQSEFSSYWFLEDVEKGTAYCLEGFLFPAKYEFYTDSTAQQVFIKFLAAFDAQFTDEMLLQIEELNAELAAKYAANGLPQSYIDEHMLTVKDVVTIASMIEKETAYTGESGSIASVIYNRLTNPGSYPYLNIDATVVYALGGKTDLTAEDKQIDSPYNTYLYKGLPPGAISNPGALSLMAALNPSDTDYYFYALDTSGEIRSHKFFRTYQEHLAFLESQE